MAKWENSNSKIHYIKPHFGEWKSAHNNSRQYEVKLSSFRFVHTRLTHRHLMSEMIGNQYAEMWKRDTYNQTLLPEVLQWRDRRKKI